MHSNTEAGGDTQQQPGTALGMSNQGWRLSLATNTIASVAVLAPKDLRDVREQVSRCHLETRLFLRHLDSVTGSRGCLRIGTRRQGAI